MRIKNLYLRKLAKKIYKFEVAKQPIDFLLNLLFGNTIYRKFCTRSLSTGLLGIGEKNTYGIASSWITVDIENADINIDFREAKKLPLKTNSISLIYCSHVFEHLGDDIIKKILAECKRVLVPGGCIRIEAPDIHTIIAAYKKADSRFFENLMSSEERKIYSIDDVFIGLLACYIENNRHVPVKCNADVIRNKLELLDDIEFTKWAISLMSEEEMKSGGHINYMSAERISLLLSESEFVNIKQTEIGKSQSVNMQNHLAGIERSHRGFYSAIVEASVA